MAEPWHKRWVECNLEELTDLTDIDKIFARLVSSKPRLITLKMIDELRRIADKERNGTQRATEELYRILKDQPNNWYDQLIKILDDERQTGASQVLKNGKNPALREPKLAEWDPQEDTNTPQAGSSAQVQGSSKGVQAKGTSKRKVIRPKGSSVKKGGVVSDAERRAQRAKKLQDAAKEARRSRLSRRRQPTANQSGETTEPRQESLNEPE